jgi:hypothetical protein
VTITNTNEACAKLEDFLNIDVHRSYMLLRVCHLMQYRLVSGSDLPKTVRTTGMSAEVLSGHQTGLYTAAAARGL